MDSTLALVDTGGDFTLVPLSILARIDAPEVQSALARGLWSEERQVTIYLVDLHLEDKVIPATDVIGVPDQEVNNEIILGRNVLNRLILLLDGPQGQTEILEQRTAKKKRR